MFKSTIKNILARTAIVSFTASHNTAKRTVGISDNGYVFVYPGTAEGEGEVGCKVSCTCEIHATPNLIIS